MRTRQEQVDVLIVGGSLAGLSGAAFLSQLGVGTLLVEQHPGSALHPRAIGYTPRTMELFRALGLGGQIPEVPHGYRLVRRRAHSLAGAWYDATEWTPDATHPAEGEVSPCRRASIAQDKLEPILRSAASRFGADIRLRTECIDLEQDHDGVTALLHDHSIQEQYQVRARFLLACDGGESPIRERLGIGRSGRGYMRTLRSVLFRAPLDEYLERGVFQFNIDQPDFKAFLVTYKDGRWFLQFADDVERTGQELTAAIVKAVGRSGLDIEILATGRWHLEAYVADTFSSGRVFLVGDSAQKFPPTRGGYGANTGIHAAHNLAWKLKAVLEGTSRQSLLDTYDEECRPVAWLRHNQIFARPDYRAEATDRQAAEPIIDDDAIEFGQRYRSRVIADVAGDPRTVLPPSEWLGEPGIRAPHLWLRQGAHRLSTLDLLQGRWVLLTEDASWLRATAETSARLGVELKCVVIGGDLVPEDMAKFRVRYGLLPGAASLIRPDGRIAWRSNQAAPDAGQALATALAIAADLHPSNRASCA